VPRAVIDQVTAPTVPLGAEFYSRARDIRRRIVPENERFDAEVRALLAPIFDRLRRYPRRTLRPEMLVNVLRDWSNMEPRDWRLTCDSRLDKGRAWLREVRLSAGKMTRGDWEGAEDDIGVTEIILTIDGNRARLIARCLACFSLHAIARRIQRHPDGSLEALMHDINLVAVAAAAEPLKVGAGYKAPTHEDGRGWRGRVASMTRADGVAVPLLSIQTWM
jgi:hypothetical protein